MTLLSVFKYSLKLLIVASFTFQVWANDLHLIEGHVRAMPATVPNTAAYFTLENHGAAIRLVAAETPVAKEAQLHTLLEENGIIKMRRVESYDIAEHGKLTLSQSGNHIMIIGLKKPLQLDQKIPLTLTFSDNSSMTIELLVKKMAMPHDHKHEHKHHH
ncbi:copper chaperone PCu(A)C [Parashewanella spongiae]|uniref:Copper chaperone PCu(A)C n=1 Tax=Parashewanella spongiae TaxID=342950 RepID=A0A3A6TX52_9GAMM|nr:copper chaperone PCu(A)C [Parashewanella spongiae]MCL1078319.1 copper chaperone PCu(A)C [Parashewanella spongiae]RJY17470.1 copper chaperone PCu(A)C [Parashewanella spongiae]